MYKKDTNKKDRKNRFESSQVDVHYTAREYILNILASVASHILPFLLIGYNYMWPSNLLCCILFYMDLLIMGALSTGISDE